MLGSAKETDVTGILPIAMVERLLHGMNERFPSPTDDELVKAFLDLRLRSALYCTWYWYEENDFFQRRNWNPTLIREGCVES